MKIQTYSIVTGTTACDGCCPYCVSKMTPTQGVGAVPTEIDWKIWRNFEKACQFAKDSGVSTVLLTGKGEPLLFLGQITDYLRKLQKYNFPFIELQTNGMRLFQEFQKEKKYKECLKYWYGMGLNTIAVSIVHYDNRENQKIFQPKGPYLDLAGLIAYLHSLKFSVRLSCIIFKGGIDNVGELKALIGFAKEHRVEQLSIRPVSAPEESGNPEVAQWVAEHRLGDLSPLANFLREKGTKLMELVHGATIYDVDGQNICLTSALTISSSQEEVRQLIFFPDGHLRYDWQYPGAILL